MIHSIPGSGTVLFGAGMIAQLTLEMQQAGACTPAVVCERKYLRFARKIARNLAPGCFGKIAVITGQVPPSVDFLILVGGAATAGRFEQDPRLRALVPFSESFLTDLEQPCWDFLVIDSMFISPRSRLLEEFLKRLGGAVSRGAASYPGRLSIPPMFSYYCRTRVESGIGALERIVHLLQDSGSSRPLVLSDKGLVSAGLVNRLKSVMGDLNILIFDSIPQDSDSRVIDEIVALYREEQRDSLVAFGGGSVLDTGKGVYLGVSTGNSRLTSWAGSGRIPRLSTPFFAIPTTSGTGSEVTKAAVVADAEQNRKVLYISPNLQPDVAILDGSLSTGLPPFLTSITGIDALSHAVEAFTCLGKNPLSDQMAWGAVERIRDNLLPLMTDPDNLEMRCEMALASSMAGQAFSNSMVGMVHAIGHSIGAVCHAPHGACMSVLLPVSLDYNRPLIDSYLAALLPALLGDDMPGENLSQNKAASLFVNRVRDMNRILREKTGDRHPERLRDLADRDGITLVRKEHFEAIARTSLGDGAIVYNPRELKFDDVLDVLERAY